MDGWSLSMLDVIGESLTERSTVTTFDNSKHSTSFSTLTYSLSEFSYVPETFSSSLVCCSEFLPVIEKPDFHFDQIDMGVGPSFSLGVSFLRFHGMII